MKALLIHSDRDLDLRDELTPQEQALVQDLQIETLLQAMGGEDKLVLHVARNVLLSSLREGMEAIRYRQEILKDCLAHPDVVNAMYQLAAEAIDAKRKLWHYGIMGRFADSILRGSVEVLDVLSGMLRKLRKIAEENTSRFHSRGFANLFATLCAELSEEYLAEVHGHLARLRFRRGVPVSARLGESNEGRDYVLHLREDRRWEWLERLLGNAPPALVVRIPDRDEAGARAYADLREHALDLVANVLSQSADHVVSFFDMLRTELAFYIGCLNLHDRMSRLGMAVAFPEPVAAGERRLRASGLCDVSLALSMGTRLVPNDLAADGKGICIITGANQGGKSAFLRGIGLAQLMMQAGLFVAADSWSAGVCNGIFTHFRREEDASMRSGKLDEELRRMSLIVDSLSPEAMVLFNESFAATNEREGSEIARQVVTALLEKRVKAVFVTHLYDFPNRLAQERAKEALFLRAERREDGTRTFKLVEGEPLETSFGQDVYREVFDGGGVGAEVANGRAARTSAEENRGCSSSADSAGGLEPKRIRKRCGSVLLHSWVQFEASGATGERGGGKAGCDGIGPSNAGCRTGAGGATGAVRRSRRGARRARAYEGSHRGHVMPDSLATDAGGVRAPLVEPLGRESELALLKTALVPGGAALILGGKGIGKSTLLAAARHIASAAGFSTGLISVTDRKIEGLRGLLAALGVPMQPEDERIRILEARLLRWCDAHRCAVLLDEADRADTGMLRTLRRIALQTSACMIVAARTGSGETPDRLRRAVLAGKEVRLGPLSPAAAQSIALREGVPPELVDEVVRRSARVPVAIVEMAHRHQQARYQVGGHVAWDLLLADLRVSNRL